VECGGEVMRLSGGGVLSGVVEVVLRLSGVVWSCESEVLRLSGGVEVEC